MAQSPVVYALIAKRSELAGLIKDLEKRAQQARIDLLHIDATLRMFDPDATPEEIKAKHRAGARLDYFKPGEITRLCREAMWADRGQPIAIGQLVVRTMQAKGLDPNNVKLRRDLKCRFRWAMRALQVSGAAERVGSGRDVRWTVPAEAPSPA